jgi:hypothetical protein
MSTASPRLLPLRSGAHVALLVESFSPIPATVATTTRREATLVFDSPQVPARMLHKRHAALETAVDGQRYRADGELMMVSGRWGKVREDAVGFHFGTSGPPLRREHSRTTAILPVTFVPVQADLAPARGMTLDVSAGGALVRASTRVDAGSALTLLLELPDDDLPVPARGRVVRTGDQGLHGVQIERMRPADRDRVLEWLAAQEPGD